MADTQPPSPAANPQSQPPTTFPEELPHRPYQKQHHPFRNCFTLGFVRSYSLRRPPNKQTRWRRITMITILLFALASAVISLLFSVHIAAIIPLAVVDFFFYWALCWALAVNGDAVGSRRVLSISWNRKVLDIVIYASLFFYIAFFLIWIFTIDGLGYQGFWLGLAAINIAVAWIASEPPYQGEPRVASRAGSNAWP